MSAVPQSRSCTTASTLFLLTLSTLLPTAISFADDRANDTLATYFEAIGGRSVWAEGKGEYVLAQVVDNRLPLPATVEFCFSWEIPQTVDRTRFQDLTQLRVFTGREGWTFRKPSGPEDGQLSNWDDERRRRGRAEWSGNFEVLTHRIARRDEAVSTRMGEGPWANWVEVSVDATVVAYLLIDEDGAPRRFHRVFDDTNVRFGPLVDRGRLRFPAWGSFDNGEPFDLIAFEILDAVPESAFRRPSVDDPADLLCR